MMTTSNPKGFSEEPVTPYHRDFFSWMNSPEGELEDEIVKIILEELDPVRVDAKHEKILIRGRGFSVPELADYLATKHDVSAPVVLKHLLHWLVMGYQFPDSMSELEIDWHIGKVDWWVKKEFKKVNKL